MKKSTIIAVIVFLAIAAISLLFNSCESVKREFKSVGSEMGGGLNRRAALLDYNGDTIKTWEGRFDIKYVEGDSKLFFDLDGKRVWIQGGIFVSEEK